MQQTEADKQKQLAAEVGSYTHDPLGFAYFAFPWGEGDLTGEDGPDVWQQDELRAIGDWLQSGEWKKAPYQSATVSGHGIGKSALIGMIHHWAMSTFEDCRVVVTANTLAQLTNKTWPEISKWARMAINADWFEVTATAVISKQKGRQKSWRSDAIPWSEHNSEAFAGLHNAKKRIVVIMDEGSAIADVIWEVIEGALTDADTEIIWLVFGNPTRTTGRLRECFGKFKHRWKTRQVDSRTVKRTNKALLQKWVDDWGEDSDFVRIRVRGEFPRASASQFIPQDIVAAARKFKAQGYEQLAKVLAVDVARFGDDSTVIGERQGRRFELLDKLHGKSTDQVAGRVAELIRERQPELVVIDGGGVGGGVIDLLRMWGYEIHEYNSGHTPRNPVKYLNCRAECWGAVRDWLKAGAEIPDDPELETDLTGPEYFFTNKNQIQLESKQDMKDRGLSSPDKGDTLAMTFAVEVAPKAKDSGRQGDGAAHVYLGSEGWMS